MAMEIDAELLLKEVEKDRDEGKPDAGDVVAQYRSWGVKADLKPHQSEGVAWLIRRHNEGLNVILGQPLSLSVHSSSSYNRPPKLNFLAFLCRR